MEIVRTTNTYDGWLKDSFALRKNINGCYGQDYDFPVNKDSLYTLISFYNQKIVTQLYQQSRQQDVYKNICFQVTTMFLLPIPEKCKFHYQERKQVVLRNNIAKEIYGSEVLLPIKIKDTPKMFAETETKRVRKLVKSIRKNNEAKQLLLKLNYHSKNNTENSVNSSGNNTT
ncbi:hypothetical protein ACTFIW_005490 [Dictyostelium discoideum]